MNLKFLPLLLLSFTSAAQTIGTFTAVQPSGQGQIITFPATHRVQVLFQSQDTIPGIASVKDAPDFTCYVPAAGSSTNGHLSLNHELSPGAVSQMNCQLDSNAKLWIISNASELDFSPFVKTVYPCSGNITPWGTIVIGEETYELGDANNDGYQDAGWLVELNPLNRTVIQKCWAAGRYVHENACFLNDSVTMYAGADILPAGYLFKFIANTPGNLSSGSLYVLQQSGTTGTWIPLPNTTQAERNTALEAAYYAGATNFSGIEDVETGPDGKIYFASKGNGVVYRFQDNGAAISNFEVFAGGMNYTINWRNGANAGSTSVPWGLGNDNMAFDNEGNLWVLQDGDDNYVWVVKPGHTQANPQVSVFMTTPAGSEPTGITFSPDNKYLFISIQHPNVTNTQSFTDAAGRTITFNRAAVLVVARKTNLGPADCVPNTWAGYANNQLWPDPENWSRSIAPLACQDVVLPAGFTVSVPGGLQASCQTLQIDAGCEFLAGPGAVLSVGF